MKFSRDLLLNLPLRAWPNAARQLREHVLSQQAEKEDLK